MVVRDLLNVLPILTWQSLPDLTLNDSANAPKPIGRPSKKTGIAQDVNEDVDVMEPEDTAVPEKDEEETSTTTIPVPPYEPPTYRIILPEIWMLISKQIRPEDVATFAAICRTTYDITRRAPFWFDLYRRFGPREQRFNQVPVEIPMRLRPESMVRLGGLRSCVIRTLFYTYRPFVQRLKNADRNLDLTSFTRRLKILQMWHVQLKPKVFAYFFRLQAPVAEFVEENRCRDPLRNVLENAEEGRRILYVETTKYVPLPQTFDQAQQRYLKAVTYNMSHGLRSYKVNLEMVLYNGSPFAKLVLDPASNIKVWDWWHPEYHQFKNAGSYVIVDPAEDFYFNM